MKRRTTYLVEQTYTDVYDAIGSMYSHIEAYTRLEAATEMIRRHNKFNLGATIVYERVAVFNPQIKVVLQEEV